MSFYMITKVNNSDRYVEKVAQKSFFIKYVNVELDKILLIDASRLNTNLTAPSCSVIPIVKFDINASVVC